MDCSMLGSSVLHCLPEFAQFHVHGVGDASPQQGYGPWGRHTTDTIYEIDTIENLRYNTGNSGDLNGKEIPQKRRFMYMYGWFILLNSNNNVIKQLFIPVLNPEAQEEISLLN